MSKAGKTPTLRLDRLLANMGYGSRREIGLLTGAGLVVLVPGRPGERWRPAS